MNCSVYRIEENILVTKNFEKPKDRGEIAHFIGELENLKLELVKLFDTYGMIK